MAVDPGRSHRHGARRQARAGPGAEPLRVGVRVAEQLRRWPGGPAARPYIPIFAALLPAHPASQLERPGAARRQGRVPAGADERRERHDRPGARQLHRSSRSRASAASASRGYLGKFFPFYEFKNGIGAGLIALFVGLIELMLEFVKPVTLSMRLFGNIYGGEVALGVITALTIGVRPGRCCIASS